MIALRILEVRMAPHSKDAPDLEPQGYGTDTAMDVRKSVAACTLKPGSRANMQTAITDALRSPGPALLRSGFRQFDCSHFLRPAESWISPFTIRGELNAPCSSSLLTSINPLPCEDRSLTARSGWPKQQGVPEKASVLESSAARVVEGQHCADLQPTVWGFFGQHCALPAR
jgi:hypothetical protein